MFKKFLYQIASFLRFSPDAIKMFDIANKISGIDKDTLPSELLSLNSIQLSRGLLNYTVIQSRLNWVLPYWAEKQYNHQSLSFIPRSHLGLSMNVTARNWTAIGNLDCDIEPIVDPHGMVTPLKNGWSVDVWIKLNDNIILPSKEVKVVQALVNNLPVVETETISNGDILTTQAYTFKTNLFLKAEVNISSDKSKSIIFSIRPFNPEGISLINKISFNSSNNSFLINEKEKLVFNKEPLFVYCSNFDEGDAYQALGKDSWKCSSDCKSGMASAVAIFECSNNESEVICASNLNSNYIDAEFHSADESIEYWQNILKRGTKIETPDEKINSLLTFSAATLLMLLDNNSITPGPFTYHQFWIRDSVFMLNALDKLGYSDLTLPVINSFKNYQDRKGYFRSQKGEWDSNGQVLWCAYQHALISGNYNFLESLFDSLKKGISWIDNVRMLDKKYLDEPYHGLMPAGLSAEHLGLVDYYFWDNFWSLAGVQSFTELCKILNRKNDFQYAKSLLNEYQNDLEKAIKKVCCKFGLETISASCTRGVDCGMIGSVSALYPTQLYSYNDERVSSTLDMIYSKFFYNGMFFQNFIHSGMNAYLTLQVAHAYLYSGNRKKFYEIFSSVVSKATSTFNFPEAIHPFTGGGIMGDGHHGWAAAEIVLASRDMFIFERFNNSSEFVELILLAGIPLNWFENKKPFSIENAPICGGKISIFVQPAEINITITINFQKNKHFKDVKWKMIIPLKPKRIIADGIPINFIGNEESLFFIPSSTKELILWK